MNEFGQTESVEENTVSELKSEIQNLKIDLTSYIDNKLTEHLFNIRHGVVAEELKALDINSIRSEIQNMRMDIQNLDTTNIDQKLDGIQSQFNRMAERLDTLISTMNQFLSQDDE